MLVRVTEATNTNLWYSDLIGSLFVVYVYKDRPYLWISPFAYILPDDVEEVFYHETKEPILIAHFEKGIA